MKISNRTLRALGALALILPILATFFYVAPPISGSDITADWPSITDDDGTGTTGTIINLANVWNVIKTAINNQVYSTTNPSIKPKDMIDEVVTARGNKASLDARLDVSLDPDGNLIAPASLVTSTQFKTALASQNLVMNGDMEDWTSGGSSAPNGWALSGAGATVARTGPSMGDTFTFGAGTYTAFVTRAGADVVLAYTIIDTTDWAENEDVESQKVSCGAKVKSSISSHARITIYDGVATTGSSYHTGGGSTEWLTATRTLSSSSTQLKVRAEVNNSNGGAYFGGFICVVSDLAPSDWTPLSKGVPASNSLPGIVTIDAQTLRGQKSFTAPMLFAPGTASTIDATVSGRLTSVTANVGNVGAGEDDLMTYTMSANALSADGKVVRVTAYGTYAANANAKTVRVKFGGTNIATPSGNFNNVNWKAVCDVVRTGASAQEAYCTHLIVGQSVTAITATGTAAIDTTAAIIIKLTGEATSNDDIVQTGMIIEVLG